MTVSPCHSDFFVYNKKLYQFLFSARDYCVENNTAQLVSISLPIDLVDPLIVFDKLSQPDRLGFYWQNPSNKEAIVAIDAVKKIEITDGDRFEQAEVFLKNYQNLNNQNSNNQNKYKNFIDGGIDLHFSQPLCFCSFRFFDDSQQTDYPFPSGTIFLPRYTVSLKGNQCQFTTNLIINAHVNVLTVLQEIQDAIAQIQSLKYTTLPHQLIYPQSPRQAEMNPDKFRNSVASALSTIAQGHLHKIVLADVLDVRGMKPFNLCLSLNNLRHLHPNCYIFATANGQGQYFIGASPERLISIRNQHLITDALAGSAARGHNPETDRENANRLLQSLKERHEHRLVIDFITQQLSQLGLTPQVQTPRIRKLSNIQHLWTPIQTPVPPYVHPLQIVGKLHPTPAVAGADRDIACEEIRHYENFERGLYAAPLGWIDANGNSEFIVGIRSALIDCDRAQLYAGAGIVAGSDPTKELAEIQLKLQALLKALV